MENSLNDKKTNEKMIQYDKKGCIKTLLFDYTLVQNHIFSLLHTDIGVDNKIVYYYFE